jgi:hypothetical protein
LAVTKRIEDLNERGCFYTDNHRNKLSRVTLNPNFNGKTKVGIIGLPDVGRE